MVYDLQKANMWKRISAWMFDLILTAILAIGIWFLLSALVGYDSTSDRMEEIYAKYSTQYGVNFEISQSEYQALSPEELQSYQAATDAMNADAEAMEVYNRLVRLSLLVTTLGIFFAILIWEFFIPLGLGDGQTLGKKIFGLCLMRSDKVKVNNVQLFARAVLGKFAIETMIPVFILEMIFWGTMGIVGPIILFGLLIAQAVAFIATQTNSALHDLIASTVVVDRNSQMIFKTPEDLIEYQKQVAAELAARATY